MEDVQITNKVVASNIIWRFLERFGAQIVTFIVSIVLARLFANNRGIYGTVALVLAITTILNVFVDGGFATSLIQKKNADNVDFSTIFWFNIVMCLVLYVGLFFLAPVLSNWLSPKTDITLLIRVLGTSLLISGAKDVLHAYVSRNMQFKKFFFATIFGTIAAAVTGLTLAFTGFGIWALVAQHLVNLILDTIILWITVKWKPQFVFSFERFKGLFSYGWKLFLSNLLNAVYNQVSTFIIGIKYTSVDLADRNRGENFPNVVVANINTAVDNVLFPSMSHDQSDKAKIKAMAKRSIKTSSFIIFPMLMGIGVCAPQIVTLLLTDAWANCVPYIQIFCFICAFSLILTTNANAIRAVGKSDTYLIVEVIKKVLGLAVIFSTMWFGVLPMTLATAGVTVVYAIINSFPNKKLINYSLKEQIMDILPQFILTVAMGVIVFLIGLLGGNSLRVLIVQVIVGVFIYFAFAKAFKLESYEYLKKFLVVYFRK